MMFSGKVLLPALAAISVLASTASAEEPVQEGPTTVYAPSLGDVMTIVQLRHAKVWYAAKLENWPLAAYELEKLDESLQQVGRIGDPSLKATVTAGVPIDPVANAISAKNSSLFDTAFRDMTDACNACHVASGKGFILIRAPTRFSPYSNQAFEPE